MSGGHEPGYLPSIPEEKRPMCAWPRGCVTILNSKSVRMGEDYCNTHRRMRARMSWDAIRRKQALEDGAKPELSGEEAFWNRRDVEVAVEWINTEPCGRTATASQYKANAPTTAISYAELVEWFGRWQTARAAMRNRWEHFRGTHGGKKIEPGLLETAYAYIRKVHEDEGVILKRNEFQRRRKARMDFAPMPSTDTLRAIHGPWNEVVAFALNGAGESMRDAA